MSAERAALVELLYLRELQASYMRRKQRRSCAIWREPEAVAEVAAMKAELDQRSPAAWAAARAVVAKANGSAMCCRSRPCKHPGVGPCDMPARATGSTS